MTDKVSLPMLRGLLIALRYSLFQDSTLTFRAFSSAMNRRTFDALHVRGFIEWHEHIHRLTPKALAWLMQHERFSLESTFKSNIERYRAQHEVSKTAHSLDAAQAIEAQWGRYLAGDFS